MSLADRSLPCARSTYLGPPTYRPSGFFSLSLSLSRGLPSQISTSIVCLLPPVCLVFRHRCSDYIAYSEIVRRSRPETNPSPLTAKSAACCR